MRLALLLGALLAGAPLAAPSGALRAQQRPPSDTARAPLPAPAVPIPAGDSAAVDSVPPRDTVKAPLAVAFRPAVPEIRGRRTIWDRHALFATGAITLTDLLAQVPGVTAFYAGYIAAPQIAAWYGQPGRVRVFLDGVELDGLDLREGNVRDLSVIQLWPLEEVAVERAAGELRVFLRSWRVLLTTAQTRTDVTTGSEQTNLYRGFFGKRMNSGAVIQLAAQQYSTTSFRTAGDGDALAGFGRLGMARGRLTIDAVGTRFGRNRNATYRDILTGSPNQDAIGAFEGRDAVGYLRAAWGDADTSTFWMQGIWAGMIQEQRGDSGAMGDTLRAGSQYIASAGLSRWGARLSATMRYRVHGGAGPRVAPSVRASWERDWFTVSAHAEENGPDSTRRLDGIATITPFRWLHFMAAHSIHAPQKLAGAPSRQVSRAEAAVRVYGRWLSVAAVQRSAGTMLGARVFDTLWVDSTIARNTGLEAGLSGQLWGPFSVEWRGISWETVQPWHPHVESHAEIRVTPDMRKRFPRGTFDFMAGFTHDYRGEWALTTPSGTRTVQGAGFIGGFIEMRIGAARIFWYNRNATGKIYETVPGYLMPRLVQLYGVRWEFWN